MTPKVPSSPSSGPGASPAPATSPDPVPVFADRAPRCANCRTGDYATLPCTIRIGDSLRRCLNCKGRKIKCEDNRRLTERRKELAKAPPKGLAGAAGDDGVVVKVEGRANPRRAVRDVRPGGSSSEEYKKVLANQEEISKRLDRLEAGMAEVLARLRGQVEAEEEEAEEDEE